MNYDLADPAALVINSSPATGPLAISMIGPPAFDPIAPNGASATDSTPATGPLANDQINLLD